MVFSSNAGLPLGPHDAFGVYAHLKHNGNLQEAAKTLSRQGYGTRQQKTVDTEEWPEPLPLITKRNPEPYPLEALPETIPKAVSEVLAFVKAPVPLVASSAIAAVSVAIQAHVDVKRAEKLTRPVGLFLLTISDSGERKSTCDGFFTQAIHEYEIEQSELARPSLKDYKASQDAWKSKRDGLLEKIRQHSKINKSTTELESSLRDLEDEKPKPPRIPRLLRGDETPENLAWVLAREWPSGSIVSTEAGIVFGAHGMGKDSIMRNLALLNTLWDGGELSRGRRTTGSFCVHGARLTMALQVQEATLRSFFDRSGGLARGTGFLARFLIAWPESTQGFRTYSDPPSSLPALDTFNKRIAEILNRQAAVDEEGALSPHLLELSADAKEAWVAFYDGVECELRSGGRFSEVRDVASKAADNVARLAALFQVFEDEGIGSMVNAKYIKSASRIVEWHLREARRFFGEFVLPEDNQDAVMLEDWLIAYCREHETESVSLSEMQEYGPNRLRSKARLKKALNELEELDHIRLRNEGRRKFVIVNPVLLGAGTE